MCSHYAARFLSREACRLPYGFWYVAADDVRGRETRAQLRDVRGRETHAQQRGRETHAQQRGRETHAQPRGREACAQHGFSLVELLIVIAIIGMLTSLTVAAVRASRESARKTQCLNNSRQLGMAVHHYHDARLALPPARIRDQFLTWAALILPYVEEGSLAATADPMLSFDMQNEAFRLTPVKIFLCPSRPHKTLLVDRRDVVGIKGDYAAMTSTFVGEGDLGVLFDGCMIMGDGTLADDETLEKWKSRTSLKNVTDGMSKTFLIAESSNWAVERASIYDGDDNPGAILGDKQYPAVVDDLVSKHALSPIAESESQPGAWVGSAHPNVVHFTMADGSSHAVRKDVDIKVVEHLVTRAGGESTTLTDVGAY